MVRDVYAIPLVLDRLSEEAEPQRRNVLFDEHHRIQCKYQLEEEQNRGHHQRHAAKVVPSILRGEYNRGKASVGTELAMPPPTIPPEPAPTR